LAAEGVGTRREATAFRVRQAQPAAPELGFEDAIFLKEIRDDLLLVLLEPSGDHGDQDLENHSRSSGWRS
jgi:hypothetical protein